MNAKVEMTLYTLGGDLALVGMAWLWASLLTRLYQAVTGSSQPGDGTMIETLAVTAPFWLVTAALAMLSVSVARIALRRRWPVVAVSIVFGMAASWYALLTAVLPIFLFGPYE